MFHGFPAEGIQFLADLAENNEKEWFNANKSVYKTQLQQPAVEFVESMGERLRETVPQIRFDTRTNGSGSLMRINRDVRFSKDKSPYKTAIAGMMWQGEGKKTVNPAFGFQLQAVGMGIMAGMFGFDKNHLAAYRRAVDDDKLGGELADIVASLEATDVYEIHGEHYKRVPREFDPEHERGRLLRFKSLYVFLKEDIGLDVVQSAELIDVCHEHFKVMAPIQQWLVKAMEGG